jgi:hypothetical protein
MPTMTMEDTIILNRKRAMTKKQYKEWLKQQRTLVLMNTGTKTHKTKKDYNSQKEKLNAKRGTEE